MTWRNDVFIARYGHQDIGEIRGKPLRSFTCLEKALFQAALQWHVNGEMAEKDIGQPTED